MIINSKVYEFAASIVKLRKKNKSLDVKEECKKLEANSKDRKKTISLVMNYINNKKSIKNFIKENEIREKNESLDNNLIKIMLSEILFSPCYKEDVFKDWKEMEFLNNFSKQINEMKKNIVLRELPKPIKKEKRKNDDHNKKKEKKIKNDSIDLFKDVKELSIKYLRINKIKTTIDDIVYELVNSLNFIQVGRKFDCFNDFLKKLFSLQPNEFMLDYHFSDDLIVVNSSCKKKFQEFRMYQQGKIIFQDKASLLSLKCANLNQGMRIADICCAPGTKTAAIASMLKNDCEMISIDIDSERIESMKMLMEKLDVKCTKIIELDFTETTHQTFVYSNNNHEIDVLFLDPSCSGSGMIDKREESNNFNEDRQRLMKLASFQTKLLCHAMSLKPKLIVYSTCSFSIWENEFVICKALEQAINKEDYELVNAFDEWPQRGDQKFSCAQEVIKAGPNRGTRGFFAAVLKRK